MSEPKVELFMEADSGRAWFLNAPLDGEFEIHVSIIESPLPFLRPDRRQAGERPRTPVMCTDQEAGNMAYVHVFDEEDGVPQIAAQWLPFFRRNCWLSGASIEASAHEKMEWVQGFTREEIEAWNLKM